MARLAIRRRETTRRGRSAAPRAKATERAPARLRTARRDLDGVSALSLAGSLDALSSPALREPIESLLAEGRFRVVVDLAELELIDSSGVAALVSLFKRARSQKGDVKIARLRGQPAQIFRLLGLGRAFDTYEAVDEATAGFAA